MDHLLVNLSSGFLRMCSVLFMGLEEFLCASLLISITVHPRFLSRVWQRTVLTYVDNRNDNEDISSDIVKLHATDCHKLIHFENKKVKNAKRSPHRTQAS